MTASVQLRTPDKLGRIPGATHVPLQRNGTQVHQGAPLRLALMRGPSGLTIVKPGRIAYQRMTTWPRQYTLDWNVLNEIRTSAKKATKHNIWRKSDMRKDHDHLVTSHPTTESSTTISWIGLHSSARPRSGQPLKGIISYYPERKCSKR